MIETLKDGEFSQDREYVAVGVTLWLTSGSPRLTVLKCDAKTAMCRFWQDGHTHCLIVPIHRLTPEPTPGRLVL